jgi:hypothetical protein
MQLRDLRAEPPQRYFFIFSAPPSNVDTMACM